jgi:hypothetical protein
LDDFCRDTNYFPKLGPHWRIVSPSVAGIKEDEPPYWPWWIFTADCPDFPPGYLIEDGHPGATLICADAIPRGPENPDKSDPYSHHMAAFINVIADEDGDEYSLLVDYCCNDAGGYDYLEFRYTRVNSGTVSLKLLSYINGSETTLRECVITEVTLLGAGFSLQACLSKGLFTGYYGSEHITVIHSGLSRGHVPDCRFPAYHAGIRHNHPHSSPHQTAICITASTLATANMPGNYR